MNALDVAKAFLIWMQNQEQFAGWDIRLGQDSDDITTDMVILDARDEPLCGSANVSTIYLSIIVETHSQDSTEADHAARVKAVHDAFFGTSPFLERSYRLAVVGAINAGQAVVNVYNYGAGPSEPNNDQNRFRTPVTLIVGASTV